MILSFYQINLRLNEELRKMLSEIIIEYMVQNKVYASPKIIEYISDGIVNVFKSEGSFFQFEIFNLNYCNFKQVFSPCIGNIFHKCTW